MVGCDVTNRLGCLYNDTSLHGASKNNQKIDTSWSSCVQISPDQQTNARDLFAVCCRVRRVQGHQVMGG